MADVDTETHEQFVKPKINTVKQRSVLPTTSESISRFEEVLSDVAAELANFHDFKDEVEQLIFDNKKNTEEREKEFVNYYNTLSGRLDGLENSLTKEFDMRKLLESEVQNAEKRLIVNRLESELEEERAKISVITDKLATDVKTTLSLLKTKIEELQSAEEAVNNEIARLRDASHSEYTALSEDCRNEIQKFSKNSVAVLENLKKTSIDFLKQCNTSNQDLIRKVPKVSDKHDKKDWLIIALSSITIIFMVLNIFLGTHS